MIIYITGLPRSGKSYRAVHDIKNKFMNPKHKDFKKHRYLYTNIGGLKIDDINVELGSHPIDTEDDVYTKQVISVDWEKLYHHIKKLHSMADSCASDDDLIAYAEKHKLSPAQFVLDECYRYFKKQSDPVLVWWLAYHGHLGHDIVLMLQNKALIHFDYKAFSEEFIDAQPKSQSLHNNQFRYYHYGSEQYIPDQRFATTKLSADQEIFKLYKSGDMHKPKKVLYKYIAIAALAFSSIFLAFYTLFYRVSDRTEIPNTDTAEAEHIESSPPPSASSIPSSDIMFQVRCDMQSCTLVTDAYEYYCYPIEYFKSMVYQYQLTYAFRNVENEIYRYAKLDTGLRKISLARLVDYYYLTNEMQFKTLFPHWFRKKEIKRTGLTPQSDSPATGGVAPDVAGEPAGV